jgi:NTE family protein
MVKSLSLLKSGRTPKIGLALSGGAARGFAHVGVLRVLDALGIRVGCISGTSVGAMVGSLYAAGYTPEGIIESGTELKWNRLITPTIPKMGLTSAKRLESLVSELIGNKEFAELNIPMSVVATDIAGGEEVVFSSGPVAPAIRASTAVPGIFEPVVDGRRAFVDGGVRNNLPSSLARRMGADIVIAVDVNIHRPANELPVNLLDVTYRSFTMLMDFAAQAGREEADILIQPELGGFSYADLSRAQEMVERGEAAARSVLEAYLVPRGQAR